MSHIDDLTLAELIQRAEIELDAEFVAEMLRLLGGER
jgi:Arc/MetJ family transcription regulator